MKLTYPESCGNSPKKQNVIDLHKYLVNYDYELILSHLDENVEVDIIKFKSFSNSFGVINLLNEFKEMDLVMFNINEIISHGNVVSVFGEINFKDIKYYYINLVEYKGFSKNAKIKYMKVYLLEK